MKAPQGRRKTVPTPKVNCPDDPSQVCREFMTKSVIQWQIWAVQANGRYFECCGKLGPDAPAPPAIDCSSVEECKEVCKAFNAWAKDTTKWARALTKAVKLCIKGWQPSASVPKDPGGPCKDCGEACAVIRDFHSQLAAWASDIRLALNNNCPGPPGLVPPPPPPPF